MEHMREANAATCQYEASMVLHWVCISSTKNHLEFLLVVSGMEWKAGCKPRTACTRRNKNTLGPGLTVRRLQGIPECAVVQQN